MRYDEHVIDPPPSDALEQLAREDDALRGLGTVETPSTPAPVAIDTTDQEAAQWAVLPRLFGSIVSGAMPELVPVYTPEKCDAWGAAMVPVARRHGWTFPDFMIYAALANATWGFVKPTADAVMVRRRVAAAAAAARPAPPGEAENPPAAAPAPAPDQGAVH